MGERDAGEAWLAVGNGWVLRERRTAPQGENHAAGGQERDALLRGARRLEAQRLVEAARAGDVGDAERDERQPRLHRLGPPSSRRLAAAPLGLALLEEG